MPFPNVLRIQAPSSGLQKPSQEPPSLGSHGDSRFYPRSAVAGFYEADWYRATKSGEGPPTW